jgi:hypothetical protein
MLSHIVVKGIRLSKFATCTRTPKHRICRSCRSGRKPEVPKARNRSDSSISKSHASSDLSLWEFYFESFKMRNIAKSQRDELLKNLKSQSAQRDRPKVTARDHKSEGVMKKELAPKARYLRSAKEEGRGFHRTCSKETPTSHNNP